MVNIQIYRVYLSSGRFVNQEQWERLIWIWGDVTPPICAPTPTPILEDEHFRNSYKICL